MSGSVPITLAFLVAMSMIARNLWPIFFDRTLLQVWRERRGKIVIVEKNRRGRWQDAILKLTISHWLSIIVAVALLVVVGARLFQDASIAIETQSLESKLSSLSEQKQELQDQVSDLTRRLEGRDQEIINLKGGPMRVVLRKLLTGMGLDPVEIETRRYTGLRFEDRVGFGRESIYYFSKKGDPVGVVYLESRIGVPVECWGRSTKLRENTSQVRRAILPVIVADAEYSNGDFVVTSRYTFTEGTTAEVLSQSLADFSRADGIARDVISEINKDCSE